MKEFTDRFSFHDVAGYWFPGIIFLALIFLFTDNVAVSLGIPTNRSSELVNLFGMSSVFAATLGTVIGLAFSYFIGTLFSIIYGGVLNVTHLFDSNENYIKLTERSIDERLKESWAVREHYVLSQLSGWNFYGEAARIRMLGTSGAAIFSSSFFIVFSSWKVAIVLCLLGILAMFVGYRRFAHFEKDVNECCYVLRELEKKQQES